MRAIFLKYKNPLVDELIVSGETEADPAKRHEIYNKLQETLHQDVPALAVYSEKKAACRIQKRTCRKASRYRDV